MPIALLGRRKRLSTTNATTRALVVEVAREVAKQVASEVAKEVAEKAVAKAAKNTRPKKANGTSKTSTQTGDTITIEVLNGIPEALTKYIASPEGKERAQMALLRAFPELDTRTPREKELDDFRAEQKARYRAKQEKLIADTLEGRRLKAQSEASGESILS